MRLTADVFHLAIPAYDLDAAEHFYVDLLGCHRARRYPDRVTINFFGDQLVCHLTDAPVGAETTPLALYPRHFGKTLADSGEFSTLYALVETRKIPVFLPLAKRFEGMAESHRTFVLRDPSDNLLEFKCYDDARMMF